MSDLIDKPDFKKAKSEALRILSEFGFDEPPIDPIRIANDMGINVRFARFSDKFNNNVSGFFDADENTIFVNSEEFPLRQTFTVGHELGHNVLHRDWARSKNYRVLLRDDTEQQKDSIEREANVFAAHLLVPRSLLIRYHKIASIKELSDLFMVSAPVIKNRLTFEFGA